MAPSGMMAGVEISEVGQGSSGQDDSWCREQPALMVTGQQGSLVLLDFRMGLQSRWAT